ncbi:hypothetical protein CAOG_00195 [Capsaspora owczarzaki ATCC 30864]|uniref:Uncharacterized protein n=1 Tax=Capsaspora owczarzaki (strain ATCC 30864) TaxID=595528 RepID=A0A0D2X072_CAPO3|nr:hypothetical protein CAOG_00195 [Capsaspora owczarzaki ATCC 30864]KJE88554.1 hypothetical protein CAOG_000195 [Capsaspora owczarzaki ATCC 30864]|eukprot:XP_004365066.1 hypothetical protein CAOG_00195 [Capsaspora owczarzaki ATCC 30864]
MPPNESSVIALVPLLLTNMDGCQSSSSSSILAASILAPACSVATAASSNAPTQGSTLAAPFDTPVTSPPSGLQQPSSTSSTSLPSADGSATSDCFPQPVQSASATTTTTTTTTTADTTINDGANITANRAAVPGALDGHNAAAMMSRFDTTATALTPPSEPLVGSPPSQHAQQYHHHHQHQHQHQHPHHQHQRHLQHPHRQPQLSDHFVQVYGTSLANAFGVEPARRQSTPTASWYDSRAGASTASSSGNHRSLSRSASLRTSSSSDSALPQVFQLTPTSTSSRHTGQHSHFPALTQHHSQQQTLLSLSTSGTSTPTMKHAPVLECDDLAAAAAVASGHALSSLACDEDRPLYTTTADAVAALAPQASAADAASSLGLPVEPRKRASSKPPSLSLLPTAGSHETAPLKALSGGFSLDRLLFDCAHATYAHWERDTEDLAALNDIVAVDSISLVPPKKQHPAPLSPSSMSAFLGPEASSGLASRIAMTRSASKSTVATLSRVAQALEVVQQQQQQQQQRHPLPSSLSATELRQPDAAALPTASIESKLVLQNALPPPQQQQQQQPQQPPPPQQQQQQQQPPQQQQQQPATSSTASSLSPKAHHSPTHQQQAIAIPGSSTGLSRVQQLDHGSALVSPLSDAATPHNPSRVTSAFPSLASSYQSSGVFFASPSAGSAGFFNGHHGNGSFSASMGAATSTPAMHFSLFPSCSSGAMVLQSMAKYNLTTDRILDEGTNVMVRMLCKICPTLSTASATSDATTIESFRNFAKKVVRDGRIACSVFLTGLAFVERFVDKVQLFQRLDPRTSSPLTFAAPAAGGFLTSGALGLLSGSPPHGHASGSTYGAKATVSSAQLAASFQQSTFLVEGTRTLCPGSERLIVLGCMMIAFKLLIDGAYSIGAWSVVAGMHSDHVHRSELGVLAALDYEIGMKDGTLAHFIERRFSSR